jgi:SprT protein
MPYYKNRYYNSKAAVVRAMYEDGSMTTSPEDKKRVAKELGMTVQTVHATIVKILGKKNNPVVKKVYTKPPTAKKPVATGNYSETRRLICDAFAKCYETAKEHGYNLDEIDIRFDIRGTTAGYFCEKLGHRFFRVNLGLAHQNLDDYLKQIVPHEFCHYINRVEDKRTNRRTKPHGREWKLLMVRVFDLNPDRCHSYDTSEVCQRRGNYFKYTCGCQEMMIGAVRHRRIQCERKKYFCRRCGRVIQLVS